MSNRISFNRKYFIEKLNSMRPDEAINPHSSPHMRRYRCMGLRKWAKMIGISPSTLSRATRKGNVDINSAIRICDWMQMPIDDFIKGKKSWRKAISNAHIIN